MSKNVLFTVDELLSVADQLRSMLTHTTEQRDEYKQRIYELESALSQNGIEIPDYEEWHGGILPRL